MSNNLMPEIMKMLGVEYGEAFKIRRPDYEVCEKGIYAFLEGEGLTKKNKQGVFDSNSSIEFEDLCLGNYEIVKLPWEPQCGEVYYWPSTIRQEVRIECFNWRGDAFDLAMKALGMVYKTKKEAQAHFAEDYERLTGKKLEEQAIVKIPWEPKRGESYYAMSVVDPAHPKIACYDWNGSAADYECLKEGLVHKTQAEAEAHMAEDYERLTGKTLDFLE